MEFQAEMANKKMGLDEVSWSDRVCSKPGLFESRAVGNAGL